MEHAKVTDETALAVPKDEEESPVEPAKGVEDGTTGWPGLQEP